MYTKIIMIVLSKKQNSTSNMHKVISEEEIYNFKQNSNNWDPIQIN